MGTVFFCFITFLLAAYTVLDGYDIGTGLLHLRLARDDAERRQLLATIGPLWDGNEVFLVAAGGTLFFAFPELYALTFSGFYLPLMVVLWLLILRGISLDFRSHLAAPPWRELFDGVFFLSSSLLAFVLGVAIGNVVRGVPVGPERVFLQPFWTDWQLGQQTGILDWYTVLVGATAVIILAAQGALWAVYRTNGAVHERARALVPLLWSVALLLTVAMSAVSFRIQPRLAQAFSEGRWRLVFPVLAFAAFVAAFLLHRRNRQALAFAAWSAFIAMLLASAAFGLYPWVLPSSLGAQHSLSIEQVQAAESSLRIGAVWWPIGIALAVGYSAFVHWKFSGKVSAASPYPAHVD